MMVWKFPLLVHGKCSCYMPENAAILTVQSQNDRPFLWAIVDPGAPMQLREFLIISTGESFTDTGLEYIGTYQQFDGELVWHVFESQEVQ